MTDTRRIKSALESLRAYVMVHGGVDRHNRLIDIEMIEDEFDLREARKEEEEVESGEKEVVVPKWDKPKPV